MYIKKMVLHFISPLILLYLKLSETGTLCFCLKYPVQKLIRIMTYIVTCIYHILLSLQSNKFLCLTYGKTLSMWQLKGGKVLTQCMTHFRIPKTACIKDDLSFISFLLA